MADDLDIDMDDLIGAPKEKTTKLYEQDDVAATRALIAIKNGVGVTWLMQAFHMDRMTVRKKLSSLPPIRQGRGNSPIYDFVQACGYLVKPRIDMKEYIKNLKPSELPNSLNKEYWDAKLKRQRWEERAGKLWRTEDVYAVLGETFKSIKSSVQLWTENLERVTGLTDEQRVLITKLGDQLLDSLYARLVEDAKKQKTYAQLAEDTEEDNE